MPAVMLFRCLYFALIAADCDIKYSGLLARTTISSGCAEISGSFFVALGPADSSVIRSSGSELIVTSSTFHQCTAIGTAYGGAIAKLTAGKLTVIRCCISECTSPRVGFAIDCASKDGEDISETSFVGCGSGASANGRARFSKNVR
jgi:hypothetical protein